MHPSFPTPATVTASDPPSSYTKLFDAMQTLIESGMKRLLPPDFDFGSLKIIGEREATNQIEHGWIIYDFLNHFIRILGDHIVTSSDYQRLEGQTQKLEAEVRGHIKLEQEIKLYIDSKARATEKQRMEYREMKQYVQYLEARVNMYERGNREESVRIEKSSQGTRSNLNLLRKGYPYQGDTRQISSNKAEKIAPKKPSLSLNRYDSQRSHSLQAFLSPRIDLQLNLKK